MANPRVLLLGGHGKISLLMTPLILARGWSLTSIVRNPEHVPEIEALAKNQPGKLDVLVRSLDDIQSDPHAQTVLDETKPDWVVWSAGAGGKGGPERTRAVDFTAAAAFIRAAAHTPTVRKFLMVSTPASRQRRAPWWTDADEQGWQTALNGPLKEYLRAKIAADRCLAAAAAQRPDWQAICLRPGTLTGAPDVEGVALGATRARGEVGRRTVAEVAVRLLESPSARGWIDLLKGDAEVGAAIEEVVKSAWDGVNGEDTDAMIKEYPLDK